MNREQTQGRTEVEVAWALRDDVERLRRPAADPEDHEEAGPAMGERSPGGPRGSGQAVVRHALH